MLGCHMPAHQLLVLHAAGKSAAGLTAQSISAQGTADVTYNWKLTKLLTTSSPVSMNLGATVTANYHITVDKSVATQTVTVSGSFTIKNTGTTVDSPSAIITFGNAPSGYAVSPSRCDMTNGTIEPGAQTVCQFNASWSDTSVKAAQSGPVTVNPGGASPVIATGTYVIAGGTAVTRSGPGSYATLSDSFVINSGSTTIPSSVATYDNKVDGLRVDDSGDYKYTVTFGNFDLAVCGTTVTVSAALHARTMQLHWYLLWCVCTCIHPPH